MTQPSLANAEGRQDLHKRFDELSAALGPAQHECNMTYNAWCEATRKWKRLVAERDAVWREMLEEITNPDAGAS